MYSRDGKDLDPIEKMLKDQLEEKPNVHWDDIAGLTVTKDFLKKTVIFPSKFPQLLTTGKCEWEESVGSIFGGSRVWQGNEGEGGGGKCHIYKCSV